MRSNARIAGETFTGSSTTTGPRPRVFTPALYAAAVDQPVEEAHLAVTPDFSLSGPTVDAVTELCERLEGLPLAIELAAARTRLLTPGAMLDRLDRRLDLLAAGPRDVPGRMVACIHERVAKSQHAR